MKKKRWKSRILALAMALAFLCGMLSEPLTALAEGQTSAAEINVWAEQSEFEVEPYATVTMKVKTDAPAGTNLTYSWSKQYEDEDGQHITDVEGVTGATLKTEPISGSLFYYCFVYKDGGEFLKCVSFSIRVDNHLEVTPVQATQRVNYGASVTMRAIVTAIDTEGLTYQWYRSDQGVYYPDWRGEAIQGANSDTYQIASANDAGRYGCYVLDKFGNGAEYYFYVEVENHLTVTPSYEKVNVAIGEKKTLTVSVSADDLTGITYRWVKRTKNPNTGEYQFEDVGNTNSYTTEALTEEVSYICHVKDRFGNATMGWFDMTMDNQLSVTPLSENINVTVGEKKTLTVTASANDLTGVTYQWYKVLGDGTFVDIAGATKNSYTTEALKAGDLQFGCRVGDRYGNVVWSNFYFRMDNHLTVTADGPTSISLPYGTSKTLGVTVKADDVTGVTYQWMKAGVDPDDGSYRYLVIDGATQSSLSIPPVTEGADYLCEVTDLYGNSGYVYFFVSVANRLQVMPLTTKTEYQKGEKATLRVKASASDASGLTYQWSRQRYEFDANGNVDYVFEDLEGSSDTYVTEKITDSWTYVCVVKDRFGGSAYQYFGVNVANHFRLLKTSGYYAVIPKNGTRRIVVRMMADRQDDIRYVWIKDNKILKDGSENYFDAREAGLYECYCFDPYGKIKRQSFIASIENHFAAEADGGNDKIVSKSGNVTLKVNVQADDKKDLKYEWSVLDYAQNEWGFVDSYNYKSIAGDGNTLQLNNVTKKGTYCCNVSDKYGNSESIEFNVFVGQKTELGVSADKGTIKTSPYNDNIKLLTVPSGETVKVKLTAKGFGSDVKYCWRDFAYDGMSELSYGTYFADGANPFTINAVSDGFEHNYECCVTDGQGNYQWVTISVIAADCVVSFDANGGSGSMPSEDYQTQIMYCLPECGFTAPIGKTFAGWEVNGKLYEEDDSLLLDGNTTVKAIWKDAEPTITVTFKHNVEFDNNIAMHYVIPKSELQGYSDLTLVIEKETYEKNVATPTIKQYVLTNPTSYQISNDDYWHFTFPGVSASEMANVLSAKLICTKDGETYVSQADVYSVGAYAYNRLDKSADDDFKKLLVDMLNYGAATQTHFGKNTANLVNKKLTKAQKKLATNLDGLVITNVDHLNDLTGATASFNGKNVMLDTNVVLAYRMTFQSGQKMDNVKVVFKYNGGKGEKTVAVPASKFEKSGSAYVAYFDRLTPREMGCTVNATIYDGSKAISGTLQYSIETYVSNRLDPTEGSTSTTYKDLLKKMVAYGQTVKNHFDIK